MKINFEKLKTQKIGQLPNKKMDYGRAPAAIRADLKGKV